MQLAADGVQDLAVAEIDAERARPVGEHQLVTARGADEHRPGARRRNGRGDRRNRQPPGGLFLPPLDQPLEHTRHQILVLHHHGEGFAVMLAVQVQHLLDHAWFRCCHRNSCCADPYRSIGEPADRRGAYLSLSSPRSRPRPRSFDAAFLSLPVSFTSEKSMA